MQSCLIYLTGVVALGLAAQWLAWRMRLPAILLLLGFGFLFGLIGREATDPELLIGSELLFPVVSLAVAVILFEGGLSLRVSELRQTGRAVLGLVTLGIAVTWILTSAAAVFCLGFEPAMATLLGAILVVSGPTVIMPLLRQVRPNRRIGSIVKWEGIVNDPIGAVLAVVVLSSIRAGGDSTLAVPGVLLAPVVFLAVGAALGLVAAMLAVWLLKNYWIPTYLQSTALLAAVLVTFTASNLLLPESGLVAVTLFGIVLANQKSVTIRRVVEFKENLRVLLISCLFIVLASRLKLDALLAIGPGGLVFLAVLLLVVRPVAVFLSTFNTDLRPAERLFLAWIHPRGIVAAAVSSVFALELAHQSDLPPALLANAEQLAAVTFLVIVGSVTVYGLSAGPLARRLGIAERDPQGVLFAGASPLVREIAGVLQQEGLAVLLVDTNQHAVARARMAGLPTCWANICSEYAREEIDVGGLGRLLAMTPNSEVNTLAAREFVELFDRAEVYHLPLGEAKPERPERLAPQRAGRVLFGSDATFGYMSGRLVSGAVVKKTGLSEEFDYNDFVNLYGESALVLFVIDESGKLIVRTTESTTEPRPGQTLITLVEPVDPEAVDSKRREERREH